jgi:hypothetical protein
MAKAIQGGSNPRGLFIVNSSESDYQSSESNPQTTYIETPESRAVEYKYSIKPENCYKLDQNLKLIRDEIVDETKKLLSGGANREYLKELQIRKSSYEIRFVQDKCRDKIEEDRLRESANLITKQSIKQEKSVLDKSFTTQKVYIGVGALVLLVGLYIVLKK